VAVLAVLAAIVGFTHLLAGLDNPALARLITTLLERPYTSRQATYDRCPQLVGIGSVGTSALGVAANTLRVLSQDQGGVQVDHHPPLPSSFPAARPEWTGHVTWQAPTSARTHTWNLGKAVLLGRERLHEPVFVYIPRAAGPVVPGGSHSARRPPASPAKRLGGGSVSSGE
jgi:hypothetical protein